MHPRAGDPFPWQRVRGRQSTKDGGIDHAALVGDAHGAVGAKGDLEVRLHGALGKAAVRGEISNLRVEQGLTGELDTAVGLG